MGHTVTSPPAHRAPGRVRDKPRWPAALAPYPQALRGTGYSAGVTLCYAECHLDSGVLGFRFRIRESEI